VAVPATVEQKKEKKNKKAEEKKEKKEKKEKVEVKSNAADGEANSDSVKVKVSHAPMYLIPGEEGKEG
jgi:hypothetical protein